MSQLSLPFREAVKTGLALSIACGLAMGMGWTNPYWAGLAVAVVSMPTVGESINKGVHRLLGTLFGGILGILCVSLFPQERWAFIGFLSLVMGFCAYRITLSRYVYFWFITSYVAILVGANVAGGSQHVFYTATVRMEETALGIIVYALVSVFIWPQQCASDVHRLVKSLFGVQAKVADHHFSRMLYPDALNGAENWYSLEAQLLSQWKRRLYAAETEQFEIHEAKGWWWQLVALCQEMMESLELWREELPDLAGCDIVALVPALPDFRRALRQRLAKLTVFEENDNPPAVPPRVELVIDQDLFAALPHFQQTALRDVVHTLLRVERLSFDIGDCLRIIRLPPRERIKPPQLPAAVARRPDGDSFAAAIRIMASLWLGALAWIYVDPPGDMMFVVFVGVHALIGLMTPQMNWPKFVLANSIGVVLASVLYIFVMPRLSGYFELSVLLFIFTVLIYYAFWDPRATMLKMAAIVPFIMLTNMQSQQQYDFAVFANNAVAMLGSMIFAGAVSVIPFSLRPEKMFVRVTTRFFRQAERVASLFGHFSGRDAGKRNASPLLGAMQTSVGKVGGWAAGIDYGLMPANPPEKAAALVSSLNTITYRFKMLADAGKRPQPLWRYCADEVGQWTTAIGELLGPWARGRFDVDSPGMLRLRLAAMEAQLEGTLRALPDGFAEDDYTNAYRLLGSYRGLYKALVAHAGLAADIDWGLWREARF
ncbi:FUSC family protein [Solidesulfovibrio sp. C21]|uniref:FUSC family protein n=1 Tax=Solidesulfovibrio sp. C21 TaxID=3398613 RepID=UPI0039FBE042